MDFITNYITVEHITAYTAVTAIPQVNREPVIFDHLELQPSPVSLRPCCARLDPEVPANKALLLMVNSNEGRKPSTSWTRPPGSTLSRRMLMLSHFHLYGELRFSGVMGRRNGLSGLRDDDDDDGAP